MLNKLAVLIPSYNRPNILELTLPQWIKSKYVNKVFIVAEASSENILGKYKHILQKYERSNKLTYTLKLGRLGSVRARNILLEMAGNINCEYVLMADDDYLPIEKSLALIIEDFSSDSKIGAVGGRVIVARRRRVDPDFFLNTPIKLADQITKLTGYIFLDVKNGPRYAEFLPPFYAVRREILDKIRYDGIYATPTAFREESDVQQQIKKLGYKLLMDPRITVIHLALEEGGNRPKITMKERMYWKAHNHTVFTLKWERSTTKRIWYMLSSALLLLIYRPWYLPAILKGLKDSVHTYLSVA